MKNATQTALAGSAVINLGPVIDDHASRLLGAGITSLHGSCVATTRVFTALPRNIAAELRDTSPGWICSWCCHCGCYAFRAEPTLRPRFSIGRPPRLDISTPAYFCSGHFLPDASSPVISSPEHFLPQAPLSCALLPRTFLPRDFA